MQNERPPKVVIPRLDVVCNVKSWLFQDNGLVPIVEPEILLDGEHGIDTTFEVAKKVWAEVFFYLAQNNVLFEGILLKPSMVTPGADCKERATPQQVADYTLKLLKQRIPPAVPGIMVNSPKFYFPCYALIIFTLQKINTYLKCSFCRVGNLRWRLHST